jgi:septal ring factor EnvC (AmiA/AmiB activator)
MKLLLYLSDEYCFKPKHVLLLLLTQKTNGLFYIVKVPFTHFLESDMPWFIQEAEIGTEESKREKEEILAKLSDVERKFAEGKSRVNKLEEDNAKLRRAVEQSVSRLNRMSMDSDYLVDRLACSVCDS